MRVGFRRDISNEPFGELVESNGQDGLDPNEKKLGKCGVDMVVVVVVMAVVVVEAVAVVVGVLVAMVMVVVLTGRSLNVAMSMGMR